ncbi:MAG: molybdenum cofactor biosynthesis protein MoaB [Desulfobacterales bacterium]|nr:molybdenum cofactor biosynthesis protein MoaB [Desulfobacterales bacterium]MBF0395499.1 molybdenum cofactor biosynthesis protein MoaB [Desulfobacterales bacterium]
MNLHKKNIIQNLKIGIITISSTRTLADDESGKWMNKTSQKEGHEVILHKVIPDDLELISKTVLDSISDYSPHALLLTGGTGIASKDLTIEAVRPLFEKELTSFGPIFSQLSFEEVDSSAILSRATAGIIQKTIVFCLPGSFKACKLACESLIFPELTHIIKHINE